MSLLGLDKDDANAKAVLAGLKALEWAILLKSLEDKLEKKN